MLSRSLLLLFLWLSLSLQAQDRPKLGVVLSGGGAKGAAHIGVLKAMEEAGLRPDFIAGTSMGSVVGGLYAIGYSADEIEQILLHIDWNLVLSNQVPLDYISFEEKEYYNRYLVEFPIEGTKLKLPSGLIEGQVLGEFMRYYLWASKEYDNFDEFPIVYRCVGTNVSSGKPILFKDGDLATAIRSSMALPTAFTAVDLDSTLVVDGGVLDNFPVEQVLALGADKIIGVNVGTKLEEPTPESMIDILMSLATIPSVERLPREMEQCDIYIEPDLDEYSTASFGNVPEIIELGKVTGQEFLPAFRDLAQEIGMNETPFSMEGRVKPAFIDTIILEGNTLFSAELVHNKLDVVPDGTYDRDDLQAAIRRVYGINGFKKVDYRLEELTDSTHALRVIMREKRRTRLFASVHFDNVFSAGILLNLTARDLLGRESRTIAAVDISKNPKARFDYYKYIGKRKAFAANFRYDFLNGQLPVYDAGEAIDINTRNTHFIGLGVLTTQSLKESIYVGADFQSYSSRSRFAISTPEGLKSQRIQFFQVRTSYTRDNTDNRNFPTSGSQFYAELTLIPGSRYKVNLDADSVEVALTPEVSLWLDQEQINEIVESITPSTYAQMVIRHKGFYPLGEKTQWIPQSNLLLTIANEEVGTAFNEFLIGGYQRVRFNDVPLLGLNYAEMEEVNFVSTGLKVQHVVADALFIRYGANIYGWYDYVPLDDLGSFDADAFFSDQVELGYGLEATWRTRLGPISGGISSNTADGYLRYYLAAGFSFNYSD